MISAATSRFLRIKIIASNVKNVQLQKVPTYNEQFLFYIFSLVSGTQCNVMQTDEEITSSPVDDHCTEQNGAM